MHDTNQITVRGWVGTDPDILITSGGKEVTKFRLASTRRFRDSTTGEWRDADTEWFTVKAWGQGGAAIRDSVRRGMPVVVQGTLSCEQWDSNDRTHHRNVITTGVVAVDVSKGRVTFARVTREVPVDDGEDEGQPGDDVVRAFPGEPDAANDPTDLADPALAPEPVDDSAWQKVEV